VLFPPVMSTKFSGRPLLHTSGLSLLLVTGAVAGLAGCGKSEAATSRTVTPESTTVGATSKAETENFVAEMTADSAYKAGTEGNVSVTLTTRNGHHTNAQYPYKFKLDAAPDGVSFPKPILQRADGTFEETKGQFKVPFTAAKAGKVTLAGTLSLSVCSDAHCIIDKVALEVPVDVK
jgi:hypothetical protein